MYPNMLTGLTATIRKLYTLEEIIVHGEKLNTRDLRSKQAIMVSEAIQALEELERTVKKEASFITIRKPQKPLATTQARAS